MSIRNIRRSALLAAGIGALAVSGLLAGRLFAHQMGDHFAGGMAPHMFNRLAAALDLTESQRAQVRAILKSHADEIGAQVRAGMDARRALHDAILAQPTDEAAIRSLALQFGAVHGDGAVLFAKIRSEVWPILSADQQLKLANFHGRMQQRGEDAMKSLDRFLRGEN